MPTLFNNSNVDWSVIASIHWGYDTVKAVHVRAGKQAFRTRIEREKLKLKK